MFKDYQLHLDDNKIRIFDSNFDVTIDRSPITIGGFYCLYDIMEYYEKKGLNVADALARYICINSGVHFIDHHLTVISQSAKSQGIHKYAKYHRCIQNRIKFLDA